MKYKTSYKYVSPSPAGPFKGSHPTDQKYKRGDEIPGVFGRAIVTSSRELKVKA